MFEEQQGSGTSWIEQWGACAYSVTSIVSDSLGPYVLQPPGKSGFPAWQADALPSENVLQECFLMVLVNLFLHPPHLQNTRIFICRPVEID